MAFSWYPGKCTTTFTHAANPLILETNGPKRAFPELCKDATPECYLNPLLFNGHLQTAWTAAKHKGPSVHYKRRVFSSDDPAFEGHFAVDFAVSPPKPKEDKALDSGTEDEGLREDPTGIGHLRLPPRTTYFTDKEFENLPSEDTRPLLITLHGLSGGSYEVYLRHVIAPLIARTEAGEKAGGLSSGDWEALVVNSRGCAGSKITTSILYNARATWDVRQVVKWCQKTFPKRPLYGIGFSLGANILANVSEHVSGCSACDTILNLPSQYLGEEGSDCALKAAVIVSSPWKLEVSSLALQRTYIGRELYSKTMGTSMRKLFDIHRDEIIKNTALDIERIEKVKYLHEFDREVQCGTWGYPTEGAYYRDASSADAVMNIRVPTLCLHATDDPIACDEAVPYEEIKQNPYVVSNSKGTTTVFRVTAT